MKDLVVFSHLRWDFVFQRPQHILSRLANAYRITFIEEEVDAAGPDGYTDYLAAPNIRVFRPHLQKDNGGDITARKRALVDGIIEALGIYDFIAWYYTPMAYAFTRHLSPALVIYDCMDELSAFLFSPPDLLANEAALLQAADLVFTGGYSLYEAKKDKHPAVYCMPSSIDKAHFAKARAIGQEPADQVGIPVPRIGFFGVIDERFDSRLIREAAARKPEWHFVIIGPVVKINPDDLPRRSNIHYLGSKSYEELPSYIRSWQIAMLPFAINEATRFISPTKTPEYLSAGKPVLSTPVKDVVRTYGENGLAAIVANTDEFIAEGEKCLQQNDPEWLVKVDRFLATMSWDELVMSMETQMRRVLTLKKEKV
ncbi:MAG: glycosyltransferase family 1 protein [Sphingobacteriales bacterium]|nr:MAG: glycosyltransferase family 1 protein [Sphingobacteriales bacterium]